MQLATRFWPFLHPIAAPSVLDASSEQLGTWRSPSKHEPRQTHWSGSIVLTQQVVVAPPGPAPPHSFRSGGVSTSAHEQPWGVALQPSGRHEHSRPGAGHASGAQHIVLAYVSGEHSKSLPAPGACTQEHVAPRPKAGSLHFVSLVPVMLRHTGAHRALAHVASSPA